MKYWNLFSIILSIFFVWSCKNDKIPDQTLPEISKTDVVEIIDDGPDRLKEDQELKRSILSRTISVDSITLQIDEVTTTLLNKKQTSFYQDKEKNNFFGRYTLMKKDNAGNMGRPMGKLVVYDSINPYSYSSNTKEFIEIDLYGPGVKVLGEIYVGMSKSRLLEVLGNKYDSIGNTLIYKGTEMTALLKIDKERVNRLKIGKYREGIVLEELMNNHNWTEFPK